MSEFSRTYLDELKRSREQVGCLYPVLVDQYGKIIDGRHRKAVFPDWPESRTEVQSPIQRLQMIIHRNLRRTVPPSETKENIIKLAVELQKGGAFPGEIAKKIHALVPYSEAYIRMLLPVEFKDPAHVESALQQNRTAAQVSCANPEATIPEAPAPKLKRIVENFGKTELPITLPFSDCSCEECPHKQACYG